MPSRRRRPALAAVLLLGSVAAAAAHAHLKSAAPAAGAEVAASPSELRLVFTERLNAAFTGATLTGPAGPVPTGPAAVAPADGEVLTVPLPGALAPGAYTVHWHALAADGHKTDGSYGFTVRP